MTRPPAPVDPAAPEQPSTRPTRRGPVALLLFLLVPLGVVLALVSGTTAPAQATTGAGFNAGNIIADSVFFNSNTMSQAGIQSFLQAKAPSCAARCGAPG